MRRQRNMTQMKEQIKAPEKELNKMEISNLSGAVQNAGYKDVKELSEDLNSIKKIQSETKDTLIEVKNPLIDLPTATKAQLRDECELSPQERCTRVYSLGDKGGCATGPYRTPSTLGHTTKTGSHRSST